MVDRQSKKKYVFLCFNNTLFVDQWPFSVALLQFGVYLSLILAIKSFAFETHWLRPFLN